MWPMLATSDGPREATPAVRRRLARRASGGSHSCQHHAGALSLTSLPQRVECDRTSVWKVLLSPHRAMHAKESLSFERFANLQPFPPNGIMQVK